MSGGVAPVALLIIPVVQDPPNLLFVQDGVGDFSPWSQGLSDQRLRSCMGPGALAPECPRQ